MFCFVLFCFVFILVPLACSVSARKSSQSLVVAPLYYNILWQNPIFCFFLPNQYETAFQVAQWQRICLPVQEMWVRSLVWEDPLEENLATHSSILAGEFRGQRGLASCSPWSCKESDTTERLSRVQQHLQNLPFSCRLMAGETAFFP